MKPHIDVIEEDSIGFEEGDSINASIDQASLGFILNTLSNLYKNPIGSIVRELTSNCHDSHVQGGCPNKAILIGFDRDDNWEQFVFFKDEGLGLSHDEMDNVYMKLGNSTKRKDDYIDGVAVLGAFGVGSKSPFSFCNDFQLIAVKDGLKNEYCYSKVTDGNQTLDRLIKDEETDEHDGFTVRIYLKTDNDKFPYEFRNKESFILEFVNQLKYFHNVYFQSNDKSLDHLNSDYKIYDYKTFMYKTGSTGRMHICFGKAVYPIDFHALGIDIINIPVGLKIELDKVKPIPSREDIEYTDDSKEYIKGRIEACLEELKELYNLQNSTTTDVFEAMKIEKVGEDRGYIKIDEFTNLDVSSYFNEPFIKYHLLNEHVTRLPDNLNQLFSSIFTVTYKIQEGRRLSKFKGHVVDLDKLIIGKKDYKNDNIKNKFINNGLIFRKSTYFNFKNFYKSATLLFGIDYHLGKKDTVKGLYFDILKNFSSKVRTYDKIKVPQDFIDSNQNVRRKRDNTKLILYDTRMSYKKDQRVEITVEELNKRKGLIIYGTPDDEKLLKEINNYVLSNRSIIGKGKTQRVFNCYYTSKRNQVYFHFLNKAKTMSVEQFMEGNNKIFIRTATALKVKKVLDGFERNLSVMSYNEHINSNNYRYNDRNYESSFDKTLELLNLDVYQKYKDLSKHINDSYTNLDSDFVKSMLNVCEERQLFDHSLLDILDEVVEYITGIEMLFHVHHSPKTMEYIIDYAKSKGKRVNLNHYKAFSNTQERDFYLEGKKKELYLSFVKDNINGATWQQVENTFIEENVLLKIA